jgi:hypothetical protein
MECAVSSHVRRCRSSVDYPCPRSSLLAIIRIPAFSKADFASKWPIWASIGQARGATPSRPRHGDARSLENARLTESTSASVQRESPLPEIPPQTGLLSLLSLELRLLKWTSIHSVRRDVWRRETGSLEFEPAGPDRDGHRVPRVTDSSRGRSSAFSNHVGHRCSLGV